MTIIPVPHHSFELDFGTPWDQETIQVIFGTPLVTEDYPGNFLGHPRTKKIPSNRVVFVTLVRSSQHGVFEANSLRGFRGQIFCKNFKTVERKKP